MLGRLFHFYSSVTCGALALSSLISVFCVRDERLRIQREEEKVEEEEERK